MQTWVCAKLLIRRNFLDWLVECFCLNVLWWMVTIIPTLSFICKHLFFRKVRDPFDLSILHRSGLHLIHLVVLFLLQRKQLRKVRKTIRMRHQIALVRELAARTPSWHKSTFRLMVKQVFVRAEINTAEGGEGAFEFELAEFSDHREILVNLEEGLFRAVGTDFLPFYFSLNHAVATDELLTFGALVRVL